MTEDGDRIRVGLDAHVVGRRKTGNEAYVVGLGNALATRDDIDLRRDALAGLDEHSGMGAIDTLHQRMLAASGATLIATTASGSSTISRWASAAPS